MTLGETFISGAHVLTRLLSIALVTLPLAAGIGLGWRVFTAPSEIRPAPSTPPAPPVALNLKEISFVLRHKGARQAELRAGRVEVSRDLRHARFVGVSRAALYDQGALVLQLRANEILLDRLTNNLQVRGPITVTSPTGDRITAREVRFTAATQRLVFPAGVEVLIGKTHVQAERLVVDLNLQWLELEGKVQIAFHLDGISP